MDELIRKNKNYYYQRPNNKEKSALSNRSSLFLVIELRQTKQQLSQSITEEWRGGSVRLPHQQVVVEKAGENKVMNMVMTRKESELHQSFASTLSLSPSFLPSLLALIVSLAHTLTPLKKLPYLLVSIEC